MALTIKICGLRRTEDIDYVNESLPDYAGFILSQGFKRSITPELFSELVYRLDDRIKSVGVFVDEPLENIREHFAAHLDIIQLHGNENEHYINALRGFFSGEIWKAVRAGTPEDIEFADMLPADKLLIDSFVKGSVGGTGKTADISVIKKARFEKTFILAGGIDISNVSSLAGELSPYGVDISSSVETDGFKDKQKITNIITHIKENRL